MKFSNAKVGMKVKYPVNLGQTHRVHHCTYTQDIISNKRVKIIKARNTYEKDRKVYQVAVGGKWVPVRHVHEVNNG